MPAAGTALAPTTDPTAPPRPRLTETTQQSLRQHGITHGPQVIAARSHHPAPRAATAPASNAPVTPAGPACARHGWGLSASRIRLLIAPPPVCGPRPMTAPQPVPPALRSWSPGSRAPSPTLGWPVAPSNQTRFLPGPVVPPARHVKPQLPTNLRAPRPSRRPPALLSSSPSWPFAAPTLSYRPPRRPRPAPPARLSPAPLTVSSRRPPRLVTPTIRACPAAFAHSRARRQRQFSRPIPGRPGRLTPQNRSVL
ncbi:hypothetical protein SAMN06272781_3098 [Streptomyces sp. 1222.2]|nr:hypothetical protein SAMN06272781_3098 [Streptomyces sp. 1222.2]